MTGPSSLSWRVRWRRLRVPGYLIIIGGLFGTVTPDTVAPSSDEILARIESETNRRHVQLKEYSGSRQHTVWQTRGGRRPDELPPGGWRALHRIDAIRLGQPQ